MREVARLIRLSLLLRIIPSAAGVVVALVVLGGSQWLLQAAAVLPSLLLLGVSLLAQRRGWTGRRFTRTLLAMVIVAYAVEIVTASIIIDTSLTFRLAL